MKFLDSILIQIKKICTLKRNKKDLLITYSLHELKKVKNLKFKFGNFHADQLF